MAAGIGLRDPWPADEPRFALIARDMVRTGHWLIPHIGGEPYSDKPPLFMWLTAAFYALLGELRVAFLLPSLLAGLGTLTLVHDLAGRLWNRRVALTAGVLLLATVHFTLQARTAQLDMMVTFWTTLGLYGLLRHLLLGPSWGWYGIAGVAMGLGVITKGVGFLPLLVFLPWAWLRWRAPGALPPIGGSIWQWLIAPAAMLLPILLWLVPMLAYVGWSEDPALAAYRDDLLFRQTLTRYANSWGHIKPAWYYLVAVIPWAWLPITLALPWLLPAWWRRLGRWDARYWLLLGFVAAVVLFFSLSSGKRHVYLLPAVPALALAAAPLLAAGVLEQPWLRRVLLVFVGMLGVVFLGIASVVWVGVGGLPELITDRHGFSSSATVLIFGALATVALGAFAWGLSCRREPAALLVFLLGFWMIHGWLAWPLLNSIRSSDDLIHQIERTVPEQSPLAFVEWHPQFLLHLNRPVIHFGYRRPGDEAMLDALDWLSDHPDGHLVMPQRPMSPCFDASRAQPLAYRHRRQWILADSRALTSACPRPEASGQPRWYDPRGTPATSRLSAPEPPTVDAVR